MNNMKKLLFIFCLLLICNVCSLFTCYRIAVSVHGERDFLAKRNAELLYDVPYTYESLLEEMGAYVFSQFPVEACQFITSENLTPETVVLRIFYPKGSIEISQDGHLVTATWKELTTRKDIP